jgi:probable F420-dependent oxidoreductase
MALEAERLGYDSVWTTDHVLMPRNSGTPYETIFESVSTLAFLSPQTKRIKLGISSLIVAMRNPVVVVKQLSTIDAFSGGRVMLAIGAGWNEKEFSFLGADFQKRGKVVNESIRLIRDLWKGSSSFESRWLPQRFEDAVMEPRPASKDLNVWIGGLSEVAMKRASNLGDAWHPNVLPLDKFRTLVAQFREVSEGKNTPICVRIGIDLKAEKAEYRGPQGEDRLKLTGDMNDNARIISELEGLGVSYAVIVPSPQGTTSLPEQLESVRAFGGRFIR